MIKLPHFFVLGLLLTQVTNAQEMIEFSGFGVIGVTTSTSDTYKYRNDVSYNDGVGGGDWDLKAISNLGLQIDVTASDKLSSTFQAVIKDRTKTNFDKYLSQAFFKYKITPQWEVRAGRTPLDLFALSEYRDINFAYPWAVTPNEVYGVIPHRNLDGLDLTYTSRLLGGNSHTRIFYGKSQSEASLGEFLEVVKTKNIRGLSFDWSTLNWSFVVKHTLFEFSSNPKTYAPIAAAINNVASGANQVGAAAVNRGLGFAIPELLPNGVLWDDSSLALDKVSMDGKSGDYSSISASYHWLQFGLSAEVSQIESESAVMPDIQSGFISTTYMVGKSTFYAVLASINTEPETFDSSGVSTLLSDSNSPLGQSSLVGAELSEQFAKLQAAYGLAIQGVDDSLTAYAADQTTLSIGWRYDLKENMALKVQIDHTRIADSGGTLWFQKQRNSSAESVNTLFVTLGFTF
ncbi:hypothetical protein [uncultured Pseudoteredinibacter sp.]|uniref:hypothetical protein n=1 Tax=uncultured Pseudoteredinibacter sp. TaxID=1641701 RepID=UPI00261B2E6E|nr:hypothetical protein [uncultured Pseudoteredinibacter sp.]